MGSCHRFCLAVSLASHGTSLGVAVSLASRASLRRVACSSHRADASHFKPTRALRGCDIAALSVVLVRLVGHRVVPIRTTVVKFFFTTAYTQPCTESWQHGWYVSLSLP